MLGGADNPNGELLSYIIGADTTSTPEFFLRKTKTSIVALEIYILV